MAYYFKNITIHLFDIHPTALLMDNSKNYVQNDFTFLLSSVKYNQQYAAGKAVETTSFSFTSLSAADLKNHFWKKYALIRLQNGKPDYWASQIPFIGKCKNVLELKHNMSNVEVGLTPTIYLSSLGWSVNIKINIKGNINDAELVNFLSWLSTGGQSPFSFVIGGQNMDKKACFQQLNKLIKQEVYLKENSPQLSADNFNYFLISINSYEGDTHHYDNIPAVDEAKLRSILRGRNIALLELQADKDSYKVAAMQITSDKKNFTFTRFDQRTLVFLQREANLANTANKLNKRKVMCFAENCKHCLIMSYLLLKFYIEPELTKSATELAQLKTGIPQILGKMPKFYTSAFCKKLFANHKELSKFN